MIHYMHQIKMETLDECDSSQVELSSVNWKESYMKSPYTRPIYQYPYAEWIPNSICYADWCTRKNTFDKWPKQMRPSAKELINAGFFYKGYGDSVECFFCGISLHDWETKDSALVEHKKWSRTCKFVDMVSHLV